MIHPGTIILKTYELDTLMNSLQQSVDNLITWTEMNHTAVHPDKTKFMLVTTRQERQNLVPNLPLLPLNQMSLKKYKTIKC